MHQHRRAHGGMRSNGAVSAKQRLNALSTAALATKRPQFGFMATDSSARRRTHCWCWPLKRQLPRASSSLKWQSPLRLAERTCAHSSSCG